jgi:hypothetical protein
MLPTSSPQGRVYGCGGNVGNCNWATHWGAHYSGGGMRLLEGNQNNGFLADWPHGNSPLYTFFRNAFSGIDDSGSKNAYRRALMIMAFARGYQHCRQCPWHGGRGFSLSRALPQCCDDLIFTTSVRALASRAAMTPPLRLRCFAGATTIRRPGRYAFSPPRCQRRDPRASTEMLFRGSESTQLVFLSQPADFLVGDSVGDSAVAAHWTRRHRRQWPWRS